MRSTLGVLVRCLDGRADGEPTDRDLLRRYADAGDEDAFALLVQRHGRLVWGVCRRALPGADAEDAFQATFLVLARKAAHLDWQPSVGPWLHAVATRLARKARGRRRSEPLPETAPTVWEWRLAAPLTVAKGVLTVAVRDKRGNVTRIERRFSAGP